MGLKRYKFVVRETNIKHLKANNRLEDRRVIVIGVQDKETGIITPSPLTDFIKIKYEYRGRDLNTQKDAARTTTQFLNMVYEEIEAGNDKFQELIHKGIGGLTLVHGSAFITRETRKKLKSATISKKENYLTQFYKYLNDLDLLEEDIVFVVDSNRKEEEIVLSPFRRAYLRTEYPNPNREEPSKPQLHNFPDKRRQGINMVREFIDTAREVCPSIAFGIALQIYGGLRRGEVVNLTKSSIPMNFIDKEIVVVVRDNQDSLFPHLRDSSVGQVKRPRLQIVLPSNYLKKLYLEHIKSRNYVKSKNPDAFFVNEDGTTMAGSTYTKNFAKVKWAYIDKLLSTEGRYNDADELTRYAWSTHIGRRIFTNTLVEMGLSDKQIALARGDKSEKSAKDYLDRLKAARSFQDAVNIIMSEEGNSSLELAKVIKDKVSQTNESDEVI